MLCYFDCVLMCCCKLASLLTRKLATLQTCKLANLQAYKCADVQNYNFQNPAFKSNTKNTLYQLSIFKSQTVNMSCSFFFFKNDKRLKLKLYSPRQMQFLRSCLPACQPQVLDDVSDFESDGERYDQPHPPLAPLNALPHAPQGDPTCPLEGPPLPPPWKGPICPQNRTVGFMTCRVQPKWRVQPKLTNLQAC